MTLLSDLMLNYYNICALYKCIFPPYHYSMLLLICVFDHGDHGVNDSNTFSCSTVFELRVHFGHHACFGWVVCAGILEFLKGANYIWNAVICSSPSPFSNENIPVTYQIYLDILVFFKLVKDWPGNFVFLF